MEFRTLLQSILGPFKFEVFFIFIFIFIPISLILITVSNKVERFIFFILNFAGHRAPTIENISFSKNMEYFKGTVYSSSVHLIDILAFVFLILMIIKKDYRRFFKFIPDGTIPVFLYFLTSCLSVVEVKADFFDRSFYALFLGGRQVLFFYCLANYFRIPMRREYQLKSFFFIAFYTFIVSFQQRYIIGFHRLGADFSHPNQMVFYLVPVMALFAPLYLNQRENNYSKWVSVVAIMSSLVCCLMSLSRGFIFNFLAAATIILIFDFTTRFKIKKFYTVFLLLFLLIFGSMKAWDTWYERILQANNPAGTAQRKAYYLIGLEVLKENMWFGIGINQFGSNAYSETVISKVLEYPYVKNDPLMYAFIKSFQDKAAYLTSIGAAEKLMFSGGIPESFYVMHFAETGIVGIFGTLFCQIFFIISCLRSIFYFRKRNIFLLNLSVGLLAAQMGMYTQSVFEYILRQENPMYLQAIIYAMISSIAGERRSKKFDKSILENKVNTQLPDLPNEMDQLKEIKVSLIDSKDIPPIPKT